VLFEKKDRIRELNKEPGKEGSALRIVQKKKEKEKRPGIDGSYGKNSEARMVVGEKKRGFRQVEKRREETEAAAGQRMNCGKGGGAKTLIGVARERA